MVYVGECCSVRFGSKQAFTATTNLTRAVIATKNLKFFVASLLRMTGI
jgi:hypothetical protein